MTDTSKPLTEGKLLLLVGAVQFVNILDFVMVMPLGPDFAKGLHIPASNLGLIGGSYTAAASVAGMVAARFLDRFDRRTALACTLTGLVLATVAGGFATGLGTMILARVLAGMFGGPSTSLALSIISDLVPPQRRGRALGKVMGAFAAATVLGVPAGLELARLGGWRLPFFAVGALGMVVAASALAIMPPMTSHLHAQAPAPGADSGFWRRPVVWLALSVTAVSMLANFALIPNLSTFLQFNLGYPRASLGMLDLIGGTVSFATLQVAGRLVDRFGAAKVALGGTLVFIAILYEGLVQPMARLPVLVFFVAFMVTNSFRMIPMQSLSSRVPAAHERARFMSIQSAVQHMAAAVGAVLASQMLTEQPDGRLVGMDRVAGLAIALSLFLPLLMWLLERRVGRQERQAAASPPPTALTPELAADSAG